MTAFDRFRASLGSDNVPGRIHDGVIGKDAVIDGPFGPKPMLYADYVASGRALRQVETFVMEEVLPWYSNSHTEASHCGGVMTRLRREARSVIRALCGAGEETAVIFTGSGATAGLNRLVHLLGLDTAVRRGDRPVVIIGPYEHHSNILPWRESGAEVVEIPEDARGGPDRQALARALAAAAGRSLVIGSFSAASNVTGILTDVEGITRQLKAAGARAVWDYAGGGPYLPIRMAPAPDAEIDAIVTSPHKFVGGPAASGLLLLRRSAVAADIPTFPGGGTVRFVSPEAHDYAANVEAREEAGTPNVVGDIRAALAFIVKDAIGQRFIDARNAELRDRALAAWGACDRIEILGNLEVARLPILSFRIRDGQGGYLHQQLATRMLSDLHGIQARGGCACAGPYVHRLLGICAEESRALRAAILSGQEMLKPGFVRLNFSYLFSDEEADRVIAAVIDLARNADRLRPAYDFDASTAIFTPRATSTAQAPRP
ncbi:aminotransferase class V-fold PLP-dependent enzyme [Albidovulum sediminicola]|uniref:Aminotransferase class V-fold PLP-dependent enzyme n=1 Tax=Albidovulum sediminicola TaxID=2984331 RepID=A0ABT2YY19_9RHOB|nr:aminotransferase class V-fold PLP-dependent enzyme [Defluviimonas sp. WL0075]MCV2863416.1 aminotransferase class V-fold PLP-dependent enzyme [Defluviimonas sp. WL0075]